MNKALALFQIGREPLEQGMNILGAHIDSPRMDVKQNPLYEIEDMEDAILGKGNDTYLNLTVDVMDIMTGLREDWGFKYSEEE